VADEALQGRRDLVTGANEDGFHLRSVDLARDVEVSDWLDLREIQSGEACPACGSALEVRKTIEVGHIFKLGTKYSETLGASVLDENGKSRPIVMGSYGIGIQRCMAAVVERHHDDAGIVWPLSVAPYEVVITQVNAKDAATTDAAGALYDALVARGIEVILDDRDERPGVKFKDAELAGFPYRITVGPKGLQDGKVEVVRRKTRQGRDVELQKAADAVAENVLEERSFSSQI
jgi:prolyl-tRNA synthetase